MADDAVETRITSVLKGLKPHETKALDARTDLFQAGILDSFGVLEFITALEKEFRIKIPNDDLAPQNLWSVEAAAKLVRKHAS